MDAEVPLLHELGYEVFVPKKISNSMECRTAKVDFSYDKHLSIDRDDLALLNGFNFYTEDWPLEIINCLNRHFDIAITPCIIPTLFNIARFFRGEIFIRVFGVAGDLNYEALTDCALDQIRSLEEKIGDRKLNPLSRIANMLTDSGNRISLRHRNALTKWLYRARDRIHLAPSYTEITLNELDFFKSRSVYLPLGFGNSLLQHSNTWVGGDPKICFVCPNLNQNAYYRSIYERFVAGFGHLPYVVAGRQELGETHLETQIHDPALVGFQERSDYDRMLQSCSLMFYHSREPRHLHYHPLEAILFGMPLIYLSGGLLCTLGGDGLPGMCQDENEAVEKASRILNGDVELIERIRNSQVKMLEKFDRNFVKGIWESNFLAKAG